MGREFDQFEQTEIKDFSEDSTPEVIEAISEVFQPDKTDKKQKDDGEYSISPLPSKIKKGRSHLLDEIILSQDDRDEISLEGAEESIITKKSVPSRISLTLNKSMTSALNCSQNLTSFDREVIDAVSTLAPCNEVLTANMIYRLIIGKDESAQVVPVQRKRVEDSLARCASCIVEIDITENFQNATGIKDKDETLNFSGQAISYEKIVHKKGRGQVTYYKILSMPPFFRYVEKLGRVSKVPLRLLDTPVSKTDNVIAMQSFLLREIESGKIEGLIQISFELDTIYNLAYQDNYGGKAESKAENLRVRKIISKILDYWVAEQFIASHAFDFKKRTLLVHI